MQHLRELTREIKIIALELFKTSDKAQVICFENKPQDAVHFFYLTHSLSTIPFLSIT